MIVTGASSFAFASFRQAAVGSNRCRGTSNLTFTSICTCIQPMVCVCVCVCILRVHNWFRTLANLFFFSSSHSLFNKQVLTRRRRNQSHAEHHSLSNCGPINCDIGCRRRSCTACCSSRPHEADGAEVCAGSLATSALIVHSHFLLLSCTIHCSSRCVYGHRSTWGQTSYFQHSICHLPFLVIVW